MKSPGRALFPQSRSYLATYDDFGLMRKRAVYAIASTLMTSDRALDARHRRRRSGVPHQQPVPGSGFFDYAGADRIGFQYGWPATSAVVRRLAPFTPCWLPTTRAAKDLMGLSLSPQHLWWQHTAGGAWGSLLPGCGLDFG